MFDKALLLYKNIRARLPDDVKQAVLSALAASVLIAVSLGSLGAFMLGEAGVADASLEEFTGSVYAEMDSLEQIKSGSHGNMVYVASGSRTFPDNENSTGADGAVAECAAVDSELNRELLARIISAFAGGEPYICQVAVGAVIMNRAANPDFPDTPPEIIFSAGAFPLTETPAFWDYPSERALRAARDALLGIDPSCGALYFFRLGEDGYKIRENRLTVSLGGLMFTK